MTHRSRLSGFIIDCKRGSLESSADFWSQALGLQVRDYNEGGEGRYARLSDGPGGLHIEVHRRLPISLTFDHRAATGGEAARFLKALLDDMALPL